MKVIILLIVFFTFEFFYSCEYTDKHILKGYIDKEEHFEDGFQDYTDYCKYIYSDEAEKRFADSEYYECVSIKDIDNIKSYFEDTEDWMAAEQRQKEYDFNTECITVGDYFCIETAEGIHDGLEYGKFDNYTLYLFDCESNTLYYIHNNI
ncbi:MAG: hypothetical protein ACI4RN_02390 [Oscillospiraceae bacterium]